MTSAEKFIEWKNKVADKSLQKQLAKMEGNAEAIDNAFYKDLEFGTGGMRGILGVGTNCLNIYTIRKVTEGVARVMCKSGKTSVAISYDSRIKSKVFAMTAATVFASHGIKVHIVSEVSPTPLLSFAVRTLSCDMGVMVTASHNPKKYNGYKLYNSSGTQILDDEAASVIAEISGIDPFEVKTRTFKYYLKREIISYIEQWVYGSFLNEIEKQSLNEVAPLKIVYTPLNGAGHRLVPEILYERGFTDIHFVEKQQVLSGRFTTCPFPNPEKPEALALAIEKAKDVDADLVLATDPDGDRVGIAVKHSGEYVLLSGNDVGVLLTDYILGTRYARWGLPKNATVVRTIVTTPLVDKIAENFGARTIKVLTGFKWIGDQINKLELGGGDPNRFVIGFEESYGYLIGTHCRDKDAIVASMLIAEMTSVYKEQGKTLVDQLRYTNERYGKFTQLTVSKKFEGASGNARMKELLSSLRTKPLKKLGGGNVVSSVDFLNQSEYDVPQSDVMMYDTDNGLNVIVRPSGTEPLIKFYITASKSEEENELLFASVLSDIDGIFI